jgi:hypothetical protein
VIYLAPKTQLRHWPNERVDDKPRGVLIRLVTGDWPRRFHIGHWVDVSIQPAPGNAWH